MALDQSTALIGAPGVTVDGQTDQGAAYIFSLGGGTLTQLAKLIASDGTNFNHFGVAVALSGVHAVVGAPNATVRRNGEQGKAYVFTGSGASWTQSAIITSSDGEAQDAFGIALALDCNSLLVGAPGRNLDTGIAYFYAPASSAQP